MIKVEGGSFWMGADNGKQTRTVTVKTGSRMKEKQVGEKDVDRYVRNYDSDANDDERPVHYVTLSSFYMGETVVTQALWKAVMGGNPSCIHIGNNLPVQTVFWFNCRKFIRKLNRLTGKTFRLPTEAEWEYAARGGKKSKGYNYAGSDTINDVAWYEGNSWMKPREVKTKSPNELGLYDMSGNVLEWCQDRYGSYGSDPQTNPTGSSSGLRRVLRGGSWDDGARYCRVSSRYHYGLGSTSYIVGFRLVLPQ